MSAAVVIPTCSHCAVLADPPARMSTADAARYIGLAQATLRYYRHAGIGPASYAIGSKVFYDRADVDSWVASQRAASMRGGVL